MRLRKDEPFHPVNKQYDARHMTTTTELSNHIKAVVSLTSKSNRLKGFSLPLLRYKLIRVSSCFPQEQRLLLLMLQRDLQTSSHSLWMTATQDPAKKWLLAADFLRPFRPLSCDNKVCIHKDLCKYLKHLRDHSVVHSIIAAGQRNLTHTTSWRHSWLSLFSEVLDGDYDLCCLACA